MKESRVTDHAMAWRLAELLGVARAEDVYAGLRYEAAVAAGHPDLARFVADARVARAVADALAGGGEGSPSPKAPPARPAPPPPPTVAEMAAAARETLGREDVGAAIDRGAYAEAAAAIEGAPWPTGDRSRTAEALSKYLRTLGDGNPDRPPRPPHDPTANDRPR